MRKLLLVLVTMLAISGAARAEREAILQNGALVIKETTEVLRVPGVPQGLSADVAYKLVTGELKEAMIKDRKEGKKIFVFSFPFIYAKVEHPEKKVTYHNRWFVEQAPNRIEESDDKMYSSLVTLWIPVLIIVAMGFLSSSRGLERKRLIIFYGGLFTGVLVGIFFNLLTPGSISGAMALGTIMGAVVGGTTGMSLVGDNPIGAVLGAVAGMLVGVIGTGFALTQDPELTMRYCRFILGVEVVCFFFFYLIDIEKRRATTKTS